MFKKSLYLCIFSISLIFSNTANAGVVGVIGQKYDIRNINNFYNGISGHSSSLLTDISISSLSGLDLLWAVQPASSYTLTEISAMTGFLSTGGRIAFLGEHGTWSPNENNRITAAISALGGSMSIVNNMIDPGVHSATSSNGQILNHDLTNGVNTYDYAAFAQINLGSNGQSLMLGANHRTTMIGYENIGAGSIFIITDQYIWDNITGTRSNDNAQLAENLLTARTGDPTTPTVASPATTALFLMGFSGIIAGARRRKNAA